MKVIFDDEALDDLQRIFAWIAKDNRRAAEDLVARIFDKTERLTDPRLAERWDVRVWTPAHAN